MSEAKLKNNQNFIEKNVKWGNKNLTDYSIFNNESVFTNLPKTNNTCTDKICKLPYGRCSKDKSICECTKGYMHVPHYDNSQYCLYPQHSWIMAIIYEIMFPGFGCIFLGYYLWGFGKIILIPGIYYKWVITDTEKLCDFLFISLIGYTLIFFHFKDLILMINGNMLDKNKIIVY